jgi:acyl-CoA synthetase (AMP-forming)/AMP-acid ligase II
MECLLLDDDGKEVAIGEPGEIFVRGPNVCLGYWKNEEATKESLSSDGWLKTGDVAVVDKEGRYWIVDRKKVIQVQSYVLVVTKLMGLGTDKSKRSSSCACRIGSCIA